jgi:BirA family transcriptional regulator, biotin operon repressor / biotin---[acetyl-CoA-carboxylase] ligase
MSELLAHVEDIWQAVVPQLPGFSVEVLPSVDSTNSELMRRARAGLTDPVLLVAEEQTGGRGRHGKGWHSRAGQSLTFSLGLPLAPAQWSGLSLAVGVSLAESLHPEVRLKWPNDLWLDGRKLGGILVETAGLGQSGGTTRMLIVGVGINIARPEHRAVFGASPPDPGMAPVAPAGWAELMVGHTAGDTLLRVAAPLVGDVLRFEREGFAAFARRFAERDALKHRAVRLSDGTEGTACGVDASGALSVHTALGVHNITSAEVSVRPC